MVYSGWLKWPEMDSKGAFVQQECEAFVVGGPRGA